MKAFTGEQFRLIFGELLESRIIREKVAERAFKTLLARTKARLAELDFAPSRGRRTQGKAIVAQKAARKGDGGAGKAWTSPKRRQMGRYMAAVRFLPKRKQARVKATLKASGYATAIRLAKSLVSASK